METINNSNLRKLVLVNCRGCIVPMTPEQFKEFREEGWKEWNN